MMLQVFIAIEFGVSIAKLSIPGPASTDWICTVQAVRPGFALTRLKA